MARCEQQEDWAGGLGLVESDGYLAENMATFDRLLKVGCMQVVRRDDIFGLMDYYCDPHLPVLPREEAQVGLNTPQNIYAQGRELPEWMHKPLNRVVMQVWRGRSNIDGATPLLGPDCDFRNHFIEAESVADAGVVAAHALVVKVARSLSSVQSDNVDLDKPIHSFGVDSLLAIELQSWITREFLADVPVFETIGGSSFAATGAMIANESLLGRKT